MQNSWLTWWLAVGVDQDVDFIELGIVLICGLSMDVLCIYSVL